MADEAQTTPPARPAPWRGCACVSPSARLCLALRSSFGRGQDGERCECACHSEAEDDDAE